MGSPGFPIFSFVVDGEPGATVQLLRGGDGDVTPPGRYVPKEEDEEPK